MISKYFFWTSAIIINLLLLTSCLNSSDDMVYEYSPDAQIYSFSIASKADTLDILSTTQFTIDQVNNRIFNKEPLPYNFHVDSIVLNITGATTVNAYQSVSIQLIPDSSFIYKQNDSISLLSLYKITTTAPNNENKKTYQFQLNIYQQDPNILSWERVSEDYLPQTVSQQKTVAFNNRFITYFTANDVVNAASTSVSDGSNWTSTAIPELSPTVQLSSLTTTEEALFLIDEDNKLFKSADGYTWTQFTTSYPIVAIYGALPSATKGVILVMVNDNGTLKLAETNDFSSLNLIEMDLMSDLSELPVKKFSTTKIESETSYTIKYIAIAGGLKTDNSLNNDIWILHEKEGKISFLKSIISDTVPINGSTLFFYDKKPYLLIASSGKNSLLYSDNNGLLWKATKENQAIPANFTYREQASVITDNNNIWIFGGISQAQSQITDVWKGRLNKFNLN